MVDLPKGKYPPHVEKRMQNLAQYKGRSLEGNKNSIANLKRPTKMPEKDTTLPAVSPRVPTPPVTLQPPRVPPLNTVRGAALRDLMTQDQYAIYLAQWNELFEAHVNEWTLPEDKLDVHTICMEYVQEMLLRKMQFSNPSKDYSQSLNQCFNRMQTARENLAARKRDRDSSKNNSRAQGATIQVSIIAGQVTRAQIEGRQEEARLLARQNDDFLEGTIVESEPEKTEA